MLVYLYLKYQIVQKDGKIIIMNIKPTIKATIETRISLAASSLKDISDFCGGK